MKKHLNQPAKLLTTAVALAFLGACASAPKMSPRLEQARSVYQNASTNQTIVNNAPDDLALAKRALANAEAAQANSKMRGDVDHYAYLTEQRVAAAKLVSEASENEKRIAESQRLRDRLVIDARTRQLNQQKRLTEQARLDAMSASAKAEAMRQLADNRLSEIQTANTALENARSDADIARQLEDQARKTAEAAVMETEAARLQAAQAKAESERANAEAASQGSNAAEAQMAAATAMELARQRLDELEATRRSAEQARMDAQKASALAQERLTAAQASEKSALAARAEAERLQNEMRELKAQPTNRGLVLTLGDVLFDTGKAGLKPGAALTTNKVAEFMGKNASYRIQIEGHTDEVGDNASNQVLSEARANAVKQALLAKGIAADRIEIAGLGEDFPVANNTTNAGRQQNRRVEIIFSDLTGVIKPR